MDLKIKPFVLKLNYDGKLYKMQVRQTYLSEQIEVFTITGGGKVMEFQSNRPLWRNKGLNKRKINWKVIDGKVNNMSALERVIKEIESHIRSIENPPFDWKDHPKNSR